MKLQNINALRFSQNNVIVEAVTIIYPEDPRGEYTLKLEAIGCDEDPESAHDVNIEVTQKTLNLAVKELKTIMKNIQ